MGNSGSSAGAGPVGSGSCIKNGSCNGCSQGGSYFSFGKVAKRKSPVRKRKSPVRKRKSPVRKRKSPVRRRKSPVRKRKSPVRRRKSPVRRRTKYGSVHLNIPTNISRISMVPKPKSIYTVPHMHFGRVCFGS